MEGPISCNFHCTLERLARHWRGYWPDTDATHLAADLSERLSAATAAWELANLEALDGGDIALVCAATQAGRPVVLKLNPRGHPDDGQLRGEGHALRFWQPTGATAELLGSRDDGFTLLMERLQPGHPLDDAATTREDKLRQLGRLVARLHSAGTPPPSFIHLRDSVPDWRAALPEIDQLLAPSDDDVLIHSDLHGGNALRAGSTWKVVDPKGVRADRHADIWALLDPMSLELLPEEPEEARETAGRWLNVYSDAAGLDPARAREWTRLRARAEALTCGPGEDPDEIAWIAALHRMADVLSAPRPTRRPTSESATSRPARLGR